MRTTTHATLSLLVNRHAATRTVTDRLEILQALIASPTVDPIFRGDVLRIPADHPAYGWRCKVEDCQRSKEGNWDLCHRHQDQWMALRADGATYPSFLDIAEPLQTRSWSDPRPCLICPELPAVGHMGLCTVHAKRWTGWERWMRKKELVPQLEDWLPRQGPLPGMGKCRVLACSELADPHPLRLCSRHRNLYSRQGRPGDARVPDRREGAQHAGPKGHGVITYGDESAFKHWCRTAPVIIRITGTLSLLGLRPLVKAEIQWILSHHATTPLEGAYWPLRFIQHIAQYCRGQDASSLTDLDLDGLTAGCRKIVKSMLSELRLVYFTRQDTRQCGFFETAHYGVLFPNCSSHFDLSCISQVWLRDLLWDYFDNLLRNKPPRSQTTFKAIRRACTELSAYLSAQAPAGGRDAHRLTEQHMLDFVADQRHRGRNGLPPLGLHSDPGGRGPKQSRATPDAVARTLTGVRRLLRFGMDEGLTTAAGLDRRFITAVPNGGSSRGGRRQPFSDEVARALAADANLELLDQRDVEDRGLRDIWETLVFTGRRANEVIKLRLECVGRINGLPVLWHDQTKVGNLDEGIRIPERLVDRLEVRQAKTIDRFFERYGRKPTPQERTRIALFPRRSTNRAALQSVSYAFFQTGFSTWVNELDIRGVPHQARHTLATKLLKAGANLSHVKRYLGQVSEAMAEHYAHIANTDPKLNEALNALWVAGPGAADPGLLLSSGDPMTREQAQALAIDLTRRSTPAEGGFCTFQPVVDGHACPWNMDCHNCDNFVLSGADLVYWHRKREQWRMLAEQAPTPAIADYFHELFEPTARAIDGLEKALAAVGLLDEALALDLRRPQDYFGLRAGLGHRVPRARTRPARRRRSGCMRPSNTAAAIAARRTQTKDKLDRVTIAISQLRRDRGRLTVRSIAQRADVSSTFLYENAEARALVQNAVTDNLNRRDAAGQAEHDRIEATWRERALNAEAELTRTQKEILAQRQRIGDLMGQIRDFDQMVPGESVQHLISENTTLKHRVQQLTQEHRKLQERLEGARSNLRFSDRRIAALEAQLLEQGQS